MKGRHARRENRSGIYSYEQRLSDMPAPYAAQLNERPAAADFFAAQPLSYRKAAIWWVISAKQESTRVRRLAQLLDDSAHRQRLKQFRPTPPTRRRQSAKRGGD